MKKFTLKKALLAVTLLGLSMTAGAQLPMTRTVFTGTYTPISTGTGATLTTIAGDDGTQALLPIGFTFNYLGTNYTTVDACANGWISFAAGGANSWTNTNLWSTTAPNNTLAAWWDDLNVGTGSVIYQTQGTPGSQTFTIQWTDVLSYNGSTRLLNFQIILYEGTNVIEFRYSQNPFANPMSTSESASVGIEGTGGAGLFLDAISGSAFVNNSYMTTHKWPNMFYRFTPGAPTVLAGGTYTVGTSGTYTSLSEALAEINHRGISGPVNLSLLDANYDTSATGGRNIFPMMLGPVAGNSSTNTITIQPASGTSTLTYRGVVSGSAGTQASTTAFGTTLESIFYVIGTDYVTMRNLNFQSTGTNNQVDRGIYVSNATTTNGAQNNLFENISVSLLRSNTSSIAIQQNVISTPASALGANSNNIYRNLSISNTYAGIYLLGNGTFPDLACAITNSSPTAFNTIGGSTAFDIGGGTATTQGYGIRCGNQSGVIVNNNEVRNVATNGVTDGILMELTQGNSYVAMNKVHDIRNNNTASTSNACGIRSNVATTAGHNLYVFNNLVYGVTSAYTTPISTRVVKGIFAQSAGGGLTSSSVNIDNNNVYIDGSANLNPSYTAFEIGTTSGPVINVRNNNFQNATANQAAPAAHYAWVSTSATLTGNTGSVSNYNNLYVNNATQGFVGLGNTTTFATLANWQAAMTGQDANSLSTDPSYTSSTDLHVNAPLLNAAATPLAWVTVDIDNQARAITPDIGADEFTPSTLDVGATLLVSPVSGGCYTSTQGVTIRIKNYAAGTLDFSVNPVQITVNITGTVTATLIDTISTGTLASGATLDQLVGTFNMSAAGTYIFNSSTAFTVGSDQNTLNDAMVPVTINYQPGTVVVLPSSVCMGSATTMTLSGNTSTSIQWQESTDGGLTWTNIVGATTSPYSITPTDTTWYRSLMCGSLASTFDTVRWIPTTPPTTTNDTVCGVGTVTLGASGNGTLNWYTASTGGTPINTGATYTTTVSTTTTFYVESNSGSGNQSVGKYDITGGGGQQTSTAYNIFDVTQACTLVGAYVYPGAAGNVVCDLRDNAGVLITQRIVPVTAADINQRTYIPLNINLTPGTGYRLAQGTGSVSMYRNSGGVVFPYNLPGYLSIYNSSAGTSFYYFFYDWQVATGCSSSRTPVDAVVIPTAPVSITAASMTLCAGDSTALTANSTNLGYTFTWSPDSSLTDSVGTTVSAFPSSTTSYIVSADSAGCVALDTITIAVNALPTAVTTMSDTIICIGQNDTLIAIDPFANPFISTNVPVTVPDSDPNGINSIITIPYSTVINPQMSMKVCMNMTHTWDGDMSFTLISPQGTQLDLCSNNGGSGDNFQGTCFTMSAVTNITAGVAPFTGNYLPEGVGGLNVYNGENTQGTWTLHMVDGAGGDIGTLNNWRISFLSNNAMAWTSNPVGFTSTNDTIIVSPATTTQYILTVTDTTTGCSNEYINTVTVRAPLSLTITGDTIICPGDTAFFAAAGTGGDGNISYVWSNGPTTPLDSVMPSALTTYYATITDGCGTPAAVDSITVDLATPIAIASVSNDTTVCPSTPLVLTSTISGGFPNSAGYSWNNGPTTAIDSITSGSAGTSMTYILTVSDLCGTTAVDSVIVSSFSATTAAVTTADTTICSGDTIVAMAVGGGGDGNLSYSWSNGPTTAIDSTITTVTTTYVVTVTDGCGQTALDSVTIAVFSAFSMTASADTAICVGDSLVLVSTPAGGDGNYSYSWSNGPITALDSIAPTATTQYTVTVGDGCGSSVTDTVNVTVNMPPTAGASQSVNNYVATFTNTSTNASSYSWDFGDGSPLDSQANPSHTYGASGNYTVTMIATNSCGSDTIILNVAITVGVEEFGALAAVGVYPNPSSEVFNISFGTAIGNTVLFEILDMQGKLISKEQVNNIAAGNVHTMNVAAYESGVYMLRITTEKGSRTFKVTKF